MSENVQPFEAEVGRVLDLVINSLYKDRDIFLRELVSNASDACDKLRYLALTDSSLAGADHNYSIDITIDPKRGYLVIRDRGIGMDHDDLVANLGTIARSGTSRFLEAIKEQEGTGASLIGQFGVGFYSAFMVADDVRVTSRKAGTQSSWIWQSNGRDGYRCYESDQSVDIGTTVELTLKPDCSEYANDMKIKEVIRRYSDHIMFPINLQTLGSEEDSDKEIEVEQINDASALWTRPKSEITADQYNDFYRHVSKSFDKPYAISHFSLEGMLEYTALLFVPSRQPFDLFDPKRKHGVSLFVRRVFISDEVENLLPNYLRFVSGIVDSQDLQLNVSRETLQHGAVIAKMRNVLVKRVLEAIVKQSGETAAEGEEQGAVTYEEFWSEFGAVLKEGLCEPNENKDKLLKLLRAKSTASKDLTSLDQYIERMRPNQDKIYYLSGENADTVRNSPQLEIAVVKGVEVLLFDDPVDEFWVPQVGEYDGKPFASLTRGDVDLSNIDDVEEAGKKEDEARDEGEIEKLIARMKAAISDQVSDVRVSKRLRDSAVCLVAPENGMDMQMERFLKRHNQLSELGQRVLEVNVQHSLIRNMAGMIKDDTKAQAFDELTKLVLDQARIIEGEPVSDPGAFSRRMSRFLALATN